MQQLKSMDLDFHFYSSLREDLVASSEDFLLLAGTAIGEPFLKLNWIRQTPYSGIFPGASIEEMKDIMRFFYALYEFNCRAKMLIA